MNECQCTIAFSGILLLPESCEEVRVHGLLLEDAGAGWLVLDPATEWWPLRHAMYREGILTVGNHKHHLRDLRFHRAENEDAPIPASVHQKYFFMLDSVNAPEFVA